MEIVVPRNHTQPSVFRPENLLREARRQKHLPKAAVPEICLLDPDGDIVRHLRRAGQGAMDPAWPCYHTDLHVFTTEHGERFGAVPCAVGAPFAVLIAEQLFACGCRLLVSITSAGQIALGPPPPYFVLIERALRDEGVSSHYLPPARFAAGPEPLLGAVAATLRGAAPAVIRGATWTTDAPFRETEAAITAAAAAGAVAVEMEAAGLYAFAAASGQAVICFAHVTNQLAQIEGDFEKGESGGAADALSVLGRVAETWRRLNH